MSMTDRQAELAANLARWSERIAAACAAAGRDREDVTLIVVTKTYPASDVRLLRRTRRAPCRARTATRTRRPRRRDCADLPLSWHFVGQLQTNKVRSVVGYADVVQSVDRPGWSTRCRRRRCRRSANGLPDPGRPRRAGRASRGERGGVAPGGVAELADAVAAAPGCGSTV